jgi:hypothetical protein
VTTPGAGAVLRPIAGETGWHTPLAATLASGVPLFTVERLDALLDDAGPNPAGANGPPMAN